jgi:hypothetical protein
MVLVVVAVVTGGRGVFVAFNVFEMVRVGQGLNGDVGNDGGACALDLDRLLVQSRAEAAYCDLIGAGLTKNQQEVLVHGL